MKQVEVTHYEFSTYMTKERFISFWHQVDEVMKFKPKTVLEIGPGPGIVTNILRKQDVHVTTVDFADDVGADVTASVLELPFEENEFDVVLCCQVLEHLEFTNFARALSEIKRVAKKGVVISLPHFGRVWPYSIYFPKIGTVWLMLNLQLFPKPHSFDGQHYWEIGKKGFSIELVKSYFDKIFGHGRDFRVNENPYHHFFVFELHA